MKTSIEIDDDLLRDAMRHSGARTKKAAVEAGLRLLIDSRPQSSILRLQGRVKWEGDLDRSRLSRFEEQLPVVSVEGSNPVKR